MSNDNKYMFVNKHKFGSPRYIKQFFLDTHLNPISFIRVVLSKMITSDSILFNLKLFVFMILFFSVIRIIQFALGVGS